METLDDWEARVGAGTWSLLMMLTSEKHAERCLPIWEAIFKGRLVQVGSHEFDCFRRDVIDPAHAWLLEKGWKVCPITGTEVRCAMAFEASVALAENYTVDSRLADQMQAYTYTKRKTLEPPCLYLYVKKTYIICKLGIIRSSTRCFNDVPGES